MTNIQGKRRHASMALCGADYGLELARGGSHVAGMLSTVTFYAAVAEVVDDFVRRYMTHKVSIFLKLLASRWTSAKNPPRHPSSDMSTRLAPCRN